MIDKGNQAVIGRFGPANFVSSEMPVIVEKSGDIVDLGVVRAVSLVVGDRPIHLARRIEIVKIVRCSQRVVRADKGDHGGKGLTIAARSQVILSSGQNAAVIARIAALTPPGIPCKFTSTGKFRWIIPQQCDRPANPIHHMHRQNFPGKAVILVRFLKMQFADRDGLGPAVTHIMHPAARQTVIGRGAIPIAEFVDMVANCQRGPCGHAHGRWRVGIGKAHTAGRQRIQMRGFDDWMAVAAKRVTAVLVGNDKEEIGRCHGRISAGIRALHHPRHREWRLNAWRRNRRNFPIAVRFFLPPHGLQC